MFSNTADISKPEHYRVHLTLLKLFQHKLEIQVFSPQHF